MLELGQELIIERKDLMNYLQMQNVKADIKDTIFNVLDVEGNLERGYSGWVCLDFAVKI